MVMCWYVFLDCMLCFNTNTFTTVYCVPSLMPHNRVCAHACAFLSTSLCVLLSSLSAKGRRQVYKAMRVLGWLTFSSHFLSIPERGRTIFSVKRTHCWPLHTKQQRYRVFHWSIIDHLKPSALHTIAYIRLSMAAQHDNVCYGEGCM